MTTERRKRRTRLAAVPPPQNPSATVDDTHESGPPLDSKGREMCTDHRKVSKETPCPTCRRCHAHSSQTADPCRRWPVPGGGVCLSHGGSAAHARKAAALRLLALADPAIDALAKVVKDTPKDSDRTRAATAILDRAGLGPSSKVEVEAKRWEDVIEEVSIVNEPGDAPPAWRKNRYAQPEEEDPED
ncbi:hypothetical protein ACX27O_24935 [Micromonospora sp. SD19]